MKRRQFISLTAASVAGVALSPLAWAEDSTNKSDFKLRYMLPSCLYGYTKLDEILPEVRKIGASAIDLWPKKHGNQREQLDALGEERFAALLKKHNVTLGCLTQYKLGLFNLKDEMRLAKRLGCSLIVSAYKEQAGLKSDELKSGVLKFFEQMKPHLAIAEENGVTIGIENHPGNLFESDDSLKWFAELRPSKNLAIAFSPYHSNQTSEKMAKLIKQIGNSMILFYAWQHGMGSKTLLPTEQQLLQLPGRGPLDFAPMLHALREIKYEGWTEIFMHEFPRGKAILPTTEEITKEINRARNFLSTKLEN